MELVTKMFGHSVPIIGFLMGEGTEKEKLLYSLVVGGETKKNATHIQRGRK